MANEYGENELVQGTAADILHDQLEWDVVYAHNAETFGENGTLGRMDAHEVVLWREFRAALRKLNPWITAAQIDEARKALESSLFTASALQVNEEKYFLIRDGVTVTERTPDGATRPRRAAVLDFQTPSNNRFLAVRELWIDGLPGYRRRTDIVGFVNGIPLLFVELKAHGVDLRAAYEDNYRDYQDAIPRLFDYNAFVMFSNGTEAKIGTLGSKYEFFHEWKRLREEEQGRVALETVLLGVCRKENFLDLFENFILYDHTDGRTVKILARNHQYLGVNEAVKAYEARKLRNGKLGVFWHTQGSGKSYSMAFFAGKIRRKCVGSPTIVVLTDREELNRQISDTFENCGLLGRSRAGQHIAVDGEDLLAKLRGNPSFIFTLIQKFNRPDAEPLYPDHDIVLMSDEAHRTQNGVLAENMTRMLPTASRIGFTGTPLLTNDNITERTFGGYVSIYDFQRAVEDGATVPLYYENRGERIEDLKNPEITERILDAIDRADADEKEQERLEREFAKEIHILKAQSRLEAIARDFVRHYSDLWTTGKAMFVCLDKVTCVRMYNLAQSYWREETERVRGELKSATQQEAQELSRKLKWMEETEMAVVVSQEQNEIRTFKEWGLDILPHRAKMAQRDLEKEYKDPENPFRVVFVCAMWLTGFDVKCLSCLYLDKPMKAHTLMQAIARANRVSEGKSNGLVVDYVGIVAALRKALADYTANRNGKHSVDPTTDKEKLIERILELSRLAESYLRDRGFSLDVLVNANKAEKLSALALGAEAVSGSVEERKTFQAYVSELSRLEKFANREELSAKDRARIRALREIRKELNKKRKHTDTTALSVEINGIISEYVQIESLSPETADSRQIDISRIDFDLLRREFARSRTKRLIFRDLEDAVSARLNIMTANNPGRTDYYSRYQRIIERYNQAQDDAGMEQAFTELWNLVQDMEDEERRYVREGFSSEEELAMYDLLRSENLDGQDIQAIKTVAVDLLRKIEEKIAALDHWTEKEETRAAVDTFIRNALYERLPDCYDITSIDLCRERIFAYVSNRYFAA